METYTCETCDEKFQTRADLAMHQQTEHSHQKSEGVIIGQPPKEER